MLDMLNEAIRNKKLYPLYLAIAAILLSGCGGQSYKSSTGTRANYTSSSSAASPSNGGTVPTPAPTPSPTPTATIGIPPITLRVGATGYTSTSVTVVANKVLRLTFTAGVQDQTIVGSGYSPNYSKIGVYIGIGTNTSPTEMLLNGFSAGGAAQTSHVFELSQSFTKTCVSSDPTCRQSVQITIEKPSNDFYCLNYGAYCPWGTVYQTHPWNGTLRIQTDDTDPL